jgi:hypothetical protein
MPGRLVGREILDGLRELKRGDYGRVMNVPSVSLVRDKTGLSQSRFAGSVGRISSYASGLGARSAGAVRSRANATSGSPSESDGTLGCRLAVRGSHNRFERSR